MQLKTFKLIHVDPLDAFSKVYVNVESKSYKELLELCSDKDGMIWPVNVSYVRLDLPVEDLAFIKVFTPFVETNTYYETYKERSALAFSQAYVDQYGFTKLIDDLHNKEPRISASEVLRGYVTRFKKFIVHVDVSTLTLIKFESNDIKTAKIKGSLSISNLYKLFDMDFESLQHATVIDDKQIAMMFVWGRYENSFQRFYNE